MSRKKVIILLLLICIIDISAILPDYVREYGIQKTNEILRQFGPARLIFATDYPDSRILQPDVNFSCLNATGFSNKIIPSKKEG